VLSWLPVGFAFSFFRPLERVFMISKLVKFVGVFVVSANALLASATPPNTTPANSVPYEVGQGWVTHFFDETNQTRWFRFGEIGGRSYCVEAVQGSVSPVMLDPNLALFTDLTGATPLVVSGITLANNDGAGEPYLVKGARVCYIALGTFGVPVIRTVKLNVPVTVASGDAGNIRLRIVETTLTAVDVRYVTSYNYNTENNEVVTSWVISLTNLANSALNLRASTIQGGAVYIYVSPTLQGSGLLTMPVGVFNAGLHYSFNSYSGVIFIAHNGPPGTVRAIYTESTRNLLGNDPNTYTPIWGVPTVLTRELRTR
jgi:hypothetical protein